MIGAEETIKNYLKQNKEIVERNNIKIKEREEQVAELDKEYNILLKQEEEKYKVYLSEIDKKNKEIQKKNEVDKKKTDKNNALIKKKNKIISNINSNNLLPVFIEDEADFEKEEKDILCKRNFFVHSEEWLKSNSLLLSREEINNLLISDVICKNLEDERILFLKKLNDYIFVDAMTKKEYNYLQVEVISFSEYKNFKFKQLEEAKEIEFKPIPLISPKSFEKPKKVVIPPLELEQEKDYYDDNFCVFPSTNEVGYEVFENEVINIDEIDKYLNEND